MKWSANEALHELLEEKYLKYNRPDFIENDPVSLPHRFTRPGDIEIAGFFAAILAWGQRKTIIAKCTELMSRMDNAPHDFVVHATGSELRALEGFRHRTFNDFDLLYIVSFLKEHYRKHASLEAAFLGQNDPGGNVRSNLTAFREAFLAGSGGPVRTSKHISTPANRSACKRLNMFLRWMVRQDDKGVDFGIWRQLRSSQLIIPCDVHVENIARKLGLTTRPKADWDMAEEITLRLKTFDENDPARFDFALFGMGIENYFSE
ncbi:TIGR02757 family protein [Leadbetterella sp. DM7]|uniref:TIGR02757 family protein n=1 Tax=Leadbetterella sp. DM7 TaxID=3235085 RepID=UPI00349ED786